MLWLVVGTFVYYTNDNNNNSNKQTKPVIKSY